MDRAEAEAIYDAGREVVVEVLLRMDRRIQQLEGRVEKLERELRKTSRNSSRPPSSDSLSRPARSKDPSGRKRGAQDGHEGHGRRLLPAWAVDEIVEHWPERCRCGHVFAGDERVAVDQPARRQVEELPPITVRVIEHHAQRVRCPECGERTRAQFSEEVASSAFGARLQAAITTLSVRNRVSRQDAVELTEELFGARISSGTVDAILTRTAAALAEVHDDLLGSLRAAPTLNMDETGWRTAGERRALWGMFDAEHAYFQVEAGRHEDHAKQLLADTDAIVTSDRWWAYAHLPLTRRQLCWAHLRRDFKAHAEGLAAEKEFGEHGLELCERVFWAWEVYTHTGERRELKRTIRALRRQYKPIIRSYVAKRARNKRCRGMAKNLLKAWPALWTFATHDGVEPTNNHAERGLRSAVIYRKLSLGSQSQDGEQRASHACSPHTPPAAYSTDRYSPTSPTPSPPTPAAIQHPYSRKRPTEGLPIAVSDQRKRPGGTIAELAAQETLAGLPGSAFPAQLEAQRVVSRTAMVAFEGNRYSVPLGLVAQTVTVRARLGELHLEIMSPAGRRVARHRRAPAGAGQILQSTEHARLLEAAVFDAFTTQKPCRRKANRPPGQAAALEAARLTGPEQGALIDLEQYAQIARVAR